MRYVSYRDVGQMTPLQNQCLGVAGPLLAPWGGIIFVQVLRGEANGWFGAVVAGFMALTLVLAGTCTGVIALFTAWARQWKEGEAPGPQVWRWLRSCVSWRSVGLALPNFGMAVVLLWALTPSGARHKLPDALSEVMGIEFLLIHSTVFLGLLALTSQARWWTRALKYGGLLMLFAMYIGVGLNNLSGWSVLSFAYLTLAKLATFRWSRIDDAELIGIALRWGSQFMFFMFFGALVGSSGFGSHNLTWGACYFGALSVLELFGAFILPETEKGMARTLLGIGRG